LSIDDYPDRTTATKSTPSRAAAIRVRYLQSRCSACREDLEAIMPLHRLVPLLASAGLLAACSSSDSTSTTLAAVSTTASSQLTATTSSVVEPFRSDLYGYLVASLDWTGRSASSAWDGVAPPGNDEAVVDLLTGRTPQQAFAFGEPTTATLDEFAAAYRAANAAEPDHPCPVTPEATAPTTIAGEPAILDEMHCPPDGSGVFVLSAFVVHDGRVSVFVTYARPGSETAMRTWFGSLLATISFDV
jgi:hypothetical protein